jgi:hypothetical protein
MPWGGLPCHLVQALVTAHLVQAIQLAAHQVVLDQPLFDGPISLGGQVVVDPDVDLLPAQMDCRPCALVTTDDGAIGEDLEGVL